VPPVEKVVDAVLLGRDRVVVRLAVHVDRLDVDLVSAPGALVGAHGAGDRERRFLREVIGPRERLLADGSLRHHGLDEPGAGAEDQEMNLAARAAVVKPSIDRDALAFVPGDILDVRTHTRQKVTNIFSSRSRADAARASTSMGFPVSATSNMSGP